MRKPTHAQLWKAQLYYWSDSIQVSIREMMDWAENAASRGNGIAGMDLQMERYKMLAFCLQTQQPVVFYRCGSKRQYIGCRYGLHGSEYLSFSHLLREGDWP